MEEALPLRNNSWLEERLLMVWGRYFSDIAHGNDVLIGFGRRARAIPRLERKAMIDRTHALSITRQAGLLALSRAAVYYVPQAVPAADLAVMRRIDALHLELPFAGSRMLRDLLRGESVVVGRCRLR